MHWTFVYAVTFQQELTLLLESWRPQSGCICMVGDMLHGSTNTPMGCDSTPHCNGGHCFFNLLTVGIFKLRSNNKKSETYQPHVL